MDQGQLEKAAKTLETARWRAGEALRGKILLQEASCRILLRRHSEFKRVYELLTQVIDKHPSLAQEAKALQRRSDDVEKRLLMVRTMSKRASTPTAYRDVGDMFLRIDDHRRAFNHYRKAIKGQLNATERARLMLAGAWCLKAQGEYARAQTLYEDLATRATGELQSMARAGAGNCALLRGQPKLAIAHYQALLVDVEKQTVDPYSRDLARCHLALGYRYSGDPAAKSALEQLSHSSSPLAHLGVKLLDKKSND